MILYLRVSTAEQADSGAGLAAQEAVLISEANRRGWTVVDVIADEGASARTLDRPGLSAALGAIGRGEADALAVAKLDRLSRSVQDFAALMAAADHDGWAVVALDLGLDMTTATGRLVAQIMASVAEWEREVIAARTRDALAIRKAQGVQLGRPSQVTAEARERIAALRAAGTSWRAIADTLNAEGHTTSTGGDWHANTARRLHLARHPNDASSRPRRRRGTAALAGMS